MKTKIILLMSILILSACTEATLDEYIQTSSLKHIQCFSGGVKILDDILIARAVLLNTGAGFSYKSKNTGEVVEILHSSCIIKESQKRN